MPKRLVVVGAMSCRCSRGVANAGLKAGGKGDVWTIILEGGGMPTATVFVEVADADCVIDCTPVHVMRILSLFIERGG